MEKQHSKNNAMRYLLNILPRLNQITYFKAITKVMPIAMPITFIALAVLTFSACSNREPNSVAANNSDTTNTNSPITNTNSPTNDTNSPTNDTNSPTNDTNSPTNDTNSPICGEILYGFVSKWDVSSSTGSGSNSVALPLVQNGTYNFTVNWGDGTDPNTITTWDDPNATHTFNATTSIFTVTIIGTIEGWQFGNSTSDALKLTEISCFGPLSLGDTVGYQFYNTKNLIITASDAPGLASTTSFRQAFYGASSLSDISDFSGWDVSAITDMQHMFNNASTFNSDISSWDVSAAIAMHNMFRNATAFNNGGAPLSWGDKVANVKNMSYMFSGATAFNADISSWDVSKVLTMKAMFQNATAFNNSGKALNWGDKVANVKYMDSMFANAAAFNADISGWHVSAVTDMSSMFANASAFNKDLKGWNGKLDLVTSCINIFNSSAMDAANKPTFTSCTP